MKYILALLLISNVFALDGSVEIVPKEPIAGESFNVIFKVNSKDGNDPVINFNPIGVEVLSREQTGTSTRTTYINGKLTVDRTISVNYEMVISKPRLAYLQKINIEMNGETKRLPTVRIRALKEARKEKDVFLRAEVNKTEAFVGESIILRYYLYSKRNITSFDIKKFPTLAKFMKRFHQEPQRVERVQLNSGVYFRRVMYTNQLYSNNVGTSRVDSLSMVVQYPYGQSNNPFSNFGFNSLKTRKKTLRSKPIDIKIKALPLSTPKGFTGLVGKHEFKFKLNKSKFLVNEPIEIDFSVVGEGALEIYEEPKFINSSKVEEFDATNDLVINKNFSAEKKFKITYLARENGLIDASTFPLVYFDPESLEFKKFEVSLPEIKIAGKVIGKSDQLNPRRKKAQDLTKVDKKGFDFNPIYKLKNTIKYNAQALYLFLIIIFLLLLIFTAWKLGYFKREKPVETIFSKVRKKGASYSDFFELLSLIGDFGPSHNKIQKSKLSEKAKKELLAKQAQLDESYKKNHKAVVKITIKTLKEIEKYNGDADGI